MNTVVGDLAGPFPKKLKLTIYEWEKKKTHYNNNFFL